MKHKLKSQSVLVMGLGLFGGGVGAARFLVDEGADVTVTDLRSVDALGESVAALHGLPIRFKLGGHDEADFRDSDLIVANPAVPRSSPFLKIAELAGVPITSEICLFVERCPSPIVGVTGSSGKTTTTTLLGEMLKRKDTQTLVGGNIGRSLLDVLNGIKPGAPVILELSSFQLDRLGDLAWSPHVAVVTNFAPNHIDVHGSLEAYRDAKRQIVKHQRGSDYAVLNGEDDEVLNWGGDGQRVVFATEDRGGVFVRDGEICHAINGTERSVCRVSDLKLPGRHNLANALAATGAAILCGVCESDIADVLKSFDGVAHRLERVGMVNDVLYVNDSIATSPDRTLVALEAFDQPIVLIAGGYDKGITFDELGAKIGEKVAHLIVMGATGEAIAECVKGETPIHRAGDLEEAIAFTAEIARPGSVVLLSPASASYDQFRNFEERGEAFRRLVQKM